MNSLSTLRMAKSSRTSIIQQRIHNRAGNVLGRGHGSMWLQSVTASPSGRTATTVMGFVDMTQQVAAFRDRLERQQEVAFRDGEMRF